MSLTMRERSASCLASWICVSMLCGLRGFLRRSMVTDVLMQDFHAGVDASIAHGNACIYPRAEKLRQISSIRYRCGTILPGLNPTKDMMPEQHP
ncbi:hypothetical protein [Teichococcus vastitatis]|uniref:Secreted protein n=1 Tax=Teichococcus vastitatis TaxID=2307076 RepID=A0ABS9WBI7_9PROT|nr:hypothetical protein [Pseudoroseomonas vastitatis]MCI0756667.1 hypothetical protein [Pseudoroseomonas vastitatis]